MTLTLAPVPVLPSLFNRWLPAASEKKLPVLSVIGSFNYKMLFLIMHSPVVLPGPATTSTLAFIEIDRNIKTWVLSHSLLSPA